MTDETRTRAKIIASLLSLYPASRNADPKDVLSGYLDAVRDIPVMYVSEAARRLNSGLIPRPNMAFAPSPPELATAARTILNADIDRAKRKERLQKQIEYRPPELTPADVERRRAIVADALKRMPRSDAKVPMTRDDAERDYEEMLRRPVPHIEISDNLRRSLGLPLKNTSHSEEPEESSP